MMLPFALALTAALPLPAPTFDLVSDAASRVEQLAQLPLTADSYRDKKRLCWDLSEYEDEDLSNPKKAAKVARRLEKLASRYEKNPHGIWRLHELRGRVFAKSGSTEKASEAFLAALDAYPSERYAQPSKQSYFHHLAVHACFAQADAEGFDAAESRFVETALADPRMEWLPVDSLEEGYLARAQSKRLKALYTKLSADLAERWPQIAADMEGRSIPDIRRVDDDPKKLFLLLGADRPSTKKRSLVLVLPGGSGQALDFKSWVTRMSTPLLDRYVVAVLSAPQWSPSQASEWVWVTEDVQKRYKAEFAVETFAEEVVETLRGDATLNLGDAYMCAWSSGGPATYRTMLSGSGTFRGAYVLGSVFHPQRLKLKRAKGLRFYLEQGVEDKTTVIRFARDAAKALEKQKATVKLVEFDGGHGFAMPDPAGALGRALAWLSQE